MAHLSSTQIEIISSCSVGWAKSNTLCGSCKHNTYNFYVEKEPLQTHLTFPILWLSPGKKYATH